MDSGCSDEEVVTDDVELGLNLFLPAEVGQHKNQTVQNLLSILKECGIRGQRRCLRS
jgi:hypothetical protein